MSQQVVADPRRRPSGNQAAMGMALGYGGDDDPVLDVSVGVWWRSLREVTKDLAAGVFEMTRAVLISSSRTVAR